MASSPPDYKYNCTDNSLLLPYYKTYYAQYFLKLFPRAVTANTITILSFLAVVIGFLTAFGYIPVPSPSYRTIVIFACIHIYLLFDHLDGMRAKETGTGSPLGEFLDHGLDMLNTPLIILSVSALMPELPPQLLLFGVFAAMFGVVCTFYSQYKTGVLAFTQLGTLEALFLMQGYILLTLNEGFTNFFSVPREWLTGLSLNGLLIAVFSISSLFSGIYYIQETRKINKKNTALYTFLILYSFLSGWVMTAGYNAQLTDFYTAVLIILPLCCSLELLGGYLLRLNITKIILGLILLTVLILVIFIISNFTYYNLSGTVIIFCMWIILCGPAVGSFAKSVYRMRSHWLWLNPPAENRSL